MEKVVLTFLLAGSNVMWVAATMAFHDEQRYLGAWFFGGIVATVIIGGLAAIISHASQS